MSEVTKPFKRGKCQSCRSDANLKIKSLCDACEGFASQDFVGRDELPLNDRAVDSRSFKPLSGYAIEDDIKAKILKLPKMSILLRQADLSQQQKRVMKLSFVGQLSFGEIATKLRISKSSVQRQMERSLEKLQFCHTKARSVRGKNNHSLILQNLYAPIDPHLYYSKCPKCESTDLHGRIGKGICLDCGWTFYVYSVEEVQASHPFPENPILDGSKY